MNSLSSTTRNFLCLVQDIPVMILKKDSGNKRPSRVSQELKSLDGKGFRVFESGDDICIVRDGSGRTFLI